jgi:hypothetical protein
MRWEKNEELKKDWKGWEDFKGNHMTQNLHTATVLVNEFSLLPEKPRL